MSLLQRVTSIDGNDRAPLKLPDDWPDWLSAPSQQRPPHNAGYGTIPSPRLTPHRPLHAKNSVRSLRHVISYDVLLPSSEQPSQALLHTGGVTAYKVSTARRVAQVFATVLACWLASGIVFGFAALKPVLINEGVYRELCTAEELKLGVEVCYEQDLRLNLFFAVASTTCNVSALPVGTILDRYGSRVSAVLGSIFLAMGALFMGSAFAMRAAFDGYMVGNVFLALGGTFIFVPSFSIANAFPKLAGLIVATVTGAFDASAAVFLFYRLAYEGSGFTFTPDKFFFGYLAVPLLILIAQFTLMTPDGYKTVPQLEKKLEKEEDYTRDLHDSDDELSDREVRRLRERRREHRESKLAELDKLLGDADYREAQESKAEERHAISGVWGALHGKSAAEQTLSPWFVLITLLTVLQMLRMNFFIASVRSQYEYMLGSEQAARTINGFFDIALPIGGVAATPVIGILLDNLSTANLLTILVTLITATGVLGSLPYTWAGYSNVILFVLLRPLYYSAMSDYATKVFGFATFGQIYGAIICLSGLGNLLQPLIDAATVELFARNPIPVNVALAALGFVFGVALVAFVRVQGRRVRKKQALEQHVAAAAEERRRLVPESIAEDESEADWA